MGRFFNNGFGHLRPPGRPPANECTKYRGGGAIGLFPARRPEDLGFRIIGGFFQAGAQRRAGR